MGRLGLSFRAFWRVLRDRAFAEEVRHLIVPRAAETPAAGLPIARAPVTVPTRNEARRSEAVTLLAVLQREARLIDFLKEPIAGYSNDQVGAAVRDIHRDASAALDRIFSLAPVRTETEGSTIDILGGFDAGKVRLVGNVAGGPPYRGALVHGGWIAAKLDLPEWAGSVEAARVVAPAEVELK